MVFTLGLRWCSFKQDISNVNLMLSDQQSTYAILRYAYDIPSSLYNNAMSELSDELESITHRKLFTLVTSWKAASGIKMSAEEEIEKSIAVNPVTGEVICDWEDYEYVAKKQPLLEMDFD